MLTESGIFMEPSKEENRYDKIKNTIDNYLCVNPTCNGVWAI